MFELIPLTSVIWLVEKEKEDEKEKEKGGGLSFDFDFDFSDKSGEDKGTPLDL